MKAIIATLGICASLSASAFELNARCHELYELFGHTSLTYEAVGKIADEMHDNQCWPVLQGVEIQSASMEPSSTPSPAAATDCSSLAPHIVQMTRDQATQSRPSILLLHSVKKLSAEFCDKLGVYLKVLTQVEDNLELVPMINPRAADTMTEEFISSCAKAIDIENPYATSGLGTDASKILNCVGTAKYAFGYSGDQPRYFYLERFPDGQEFYGIAAVRE